MKRKILMATVIATAIFGCTKEENNLSSSTPKSQEVSTARLTGEDFHWKTLETKNYNRNNHKPPKGVPGNDGVLTIVIVEWDEWGRAKKDCRGAGLCNANWFPEFRTVVVPTGGPGNGNTPKPIKKHAFAVEYNDVIQEYYIDVLVRNPMPTPIPTELMSLPIEEDIVLDTQSELGFDLIMKTGDYVFDSTLGQFGGYRINFN